MKRVEVLMSTYNGGKYVERQMLSILRQTNVDVHISVRDDGSSDNTVDVIESVRRIYQDKISIYRGSNVGYRKSFLSLLSLVGDSDYYAFADQDDVWEPNKLSMAVGQLETEKNPIKLYASNLILVDEKLSVIGRTQFKKDFSSLKSDFSRHRFAGCTYVFSQKMKELASRINGIDLSGKRFPDYDHFISSLAYSCGVVILDENAFIKHVRLDSSVTAGGNGFVKRFKAECGAFFKGKYAASDLACILLDIYKQEIMPEARCFLAHIKNYNRSLRDKILLMNMENFTTGIKVLDAERDIKILLSKY